MHQGKKIGFISHLGQKTLVLRHVAVILDNSLHPLGHGVAEAGQVVPADVLSPHLEDGLLQLGDGGDVLIGELVFHEIPCIFNGIQVRRVTRPVCHFKGLVLDPL